MTQKTGKITHEGNLELNGLQIPCFVLEDGTRVLSGRGFQEALRIREKPEEGEKRGGYILPTFLGSKSLKPFIDSKLGLAKFEPIICYKGSQRLHGYEATVLIEVCDAILEARKQGVKMTERQQIVADQCEILIRALAKVGVIALVDEATGYQYDREKDELQKILKAYIGEELLSWRKRFPDEFYREIFRLNGWDFTVKGIQQRPGIIGTWTKQFIYSQLPKGVLPVLLKNTPKSSTGKLKNKLHQSLTEETGVPHLEKQLVSVVTLMNISKDWKEFRGFFERKFGQQAIDFDAKEPPKPQKSSFDIALTGLLSVPPPPKEPKGEEPEDEESTPSEEPKEPKKPRKK